MSTDRKSVAFALGGLPVRLTLAGERWVARVGESVAVAGSAQRALLAALELSSSARPSVLLADLALLEPSIKINRIEAEARSA